MNTIHVTPAYGRDYKSKKAVEEAFRAGKDFMINDMSNPYDGKPCNRTDLLAGGYVNVQVRFGNLRKVAILEVK